MDIIGIIGLIIMAFVGLAAVGGALGEVAWRFIVKGEKKAALFDRAAVKAAQFRAKIGRELAERDINRRWTRACEKELERNADAINRLQLGMRS